MQIAPPAHALLQHDALDSGAATPRQTSYHRDDSVGDTFAIPESVRKSQTLDAFANVCSEVLPQFLYVSNVRVASDAQALQALGITHVIDCCSELTRASPEAAGICQRTLRIERLALALRDDVQEDLSWFVYLAIAFIERARSASSASRVLVHCHQGVSRSCALVVAYVMFRQQQEQQRCVSFRDALAFVKAKRPIASPNTAFLCQLIEWERELATFSPATASPSPVNTLYRLAPHAPHDAATLVLKCCYAPDAAAMRTAVAMPLTPDGDSDGSASTSPRQQPQWLYARGVFAFLQQTPSIAQASESEALTAGAKWRVVVWRGRQCAIPDGVATTKTLVAQMALVRGARQTQDADRVDIVEVVDADESEGVYAGTLVDHFGYAAELEWLTNTSASATASLVSSDTTAAEANSGANSCADDVDDKPQLFVFEQMDGDSGSWDHLTDYDADDLTRDDAFLLLQPASRRHFLWIGAACPVNRAALLQCAASHVRAVRTQQESHQASTQSDGTSNDSGIEIVQSGDESDAFWIAFERGY